MIEGGGRKDRNEHEKIEAREGHTLAIKMNETLLGGLIVDFKILFKTSSVEILRGQLYVKIHCSLNSSF